MSPKLLARIVEVFYANKKKPEKAMAGAIKYWEKYLSTLETRNSSTEMLYDATVEDGCVWVSQAWCDFTGAPLPAHLGHGWQKFVDPENAAKIAAFATKNAKQHRNSFKVYRARRHDGVYRWVLDLSLAAEDPPANFKGYRGIVIDIHDQIEYLTNSLMISKEKLALTEACNSDFFGSAREKHTEDH